ncbi:MAG TPA: sigma-70 family RNA polymerase sigma factor [Vicinamibacteria bacterium]|nr:sigma-70 family RNA polymerase sigma factor [Vicinamibacteria bacterium]
MHHDLDEDFRAAAVACLDGLYGFALALSRDRGAAEDLVQETYVRALAARRRASPGENLRGWLFTILRNIWKNERRRRRPEAVDDVDSIATAPGVADPETALDRRELRERLSQALDGLPGPFREVVMLRCVLGFSYQEVAGIVGCPAGTVMSRLARARAQLRRSLDATNGAGPGGSA